METYVVGSNISTDYYQLITNSNLIVLDTYDYINLTDTDLYVKNYLVGTIQSILAFITISGNCLVMAAVITNPSLQSVTNFFIMSLAVSDLIMGSLVMPFAIILEINSQNWPFGDIFCDIWHSFDVLASTASILNLAVISYDRHIAIKDAIGYQKKMTERKSFILIGITWICSSAISFPAIQWWRTVRNPESLTIGVCMFTDDSYYLIISSIISFYLPLLIIMCAYYNIYKAAIYQSKCLESGRKEIQTSGKNQEVTYLRMHRGGTQSSVVSEIDRYSEISLRDASFSSKGSKKDHNYVTKTNKWKSASRRKSSSRFLKERKAAKTLGIVVGIFFTCWTPFFVMNLLDVICSDKCLPHKDIAFPIVTWLGYVNSAMNPFIYAYSMNDFRRTFIKLLSKCVPTCCQFRVSN